MSIATRTGDNGSTALMYGRRVPKDHARVEAYGTVDELNAYLGMAKATAGDSWIKDELTFIQKDLVAIMGELAVAEEDLARYLVSDYPRPLPSMLEHLDMLVKTIEGQSIEFKGWATPGQTQHAAALDVARTVCRRAERRVFHLGKETPRPTALTLQYLNRLSDVLWLMARREETSLTKP